MLGTELYIFPNSYIETLPLNVITFIDRDFKEVINVENEVIRWGLDLIWLISLPEERGNRNEHTEKCHVKTQWEGDRLQAKKEASGESKSAYTLISNF